MGAPLYQTLRSHVTPAPGEASSRRCRSAKGAHLKFLGVGSTLLVGMEAAGGKRATSFCKSQVRVGGLSRVAT